jgi:hypothetical protein
MKTLLCVASPDGKPLNLPNDCRLLAIRPYSDLPGDNKLAIVLCFNYVKLEYVSYLYNYGDMGCACGHYFDNFRDAMRSFCEGAVEACAVKAESEAENA